MPLAQLGKWQPPTDAYGDDLVERIGGTGSLGSRSLRLFASKQIRDLPYCETRFHNGEHARDSENEVPFNVRCDRNTVVAKVYKESSTHLCFDLVNIGGLVQTLDRPFRELIRKPFKEACNLQSEQDYAALEGRYYYGIDLFLQPATIVWQTLFEFMKTREGQALSAKTLMVEILKIEILIQKMNPGAARDGMIHLNPFKVALLQWLLPTEISQTRDIVLECLARRTGFFTFKDVRAELHQELALFEVSETETNTASPRRRQLFARRFLNLLKEMSTIRETLVDHELEGFDTTSADRAKIHSCEVARDGTINCECPAIDEIDL